MQTKSTAWVLAALMCGAAIAGVAGKPTQTRGDQVIKLETAIPKQFGEWTEVPDQGGVVENPETKKLLDRLYSQILTRTYRTVVDGKDYRVMLSMAYGDDQRGGLQAHRPEVCYPAQGFTVLTLQDGPLATSFGDIAVRRLTTVGAKGAREEPVTYWLTVGDHVIRNKFDKRMMEFRLAFTGQIPDGLLFRVSSIDKDAKRAFEMQERFAADLLRSVPAETRRQLSGLAPSGAA